DAERDVAHGCGDAGRNRRVEQHPDRGIHTPSARGRRECSGGGRAGLPSPFAAGVDDFAGDDYRTAADGAEAGGRRRGLCVARAIIGGLSVSVVLTVMLVPAAYLLVHGNREAG